MKKFTLALFLISLSTLAQVPTEFPMQMLRKLVDETQKASVVVFGENSHGYGAAPQFLTSYIKTADPSHFDYIGLEIPDTYQNQIDNLINDFTEVRFNDFYFEIYGDSEFSRSKKKHYLDFYQTLADQNTFRKNQGLPPLRVLAVDADSHDNEPLEEWFYRRDQQMFEHLKEASMNFRKKGIVYVGLGHASYSPFPVPANFGLTRPIEPLGSLLRKHLGADQIKSIWFTQRLIYLDFFLRIPPDFRAFFRWLNKVSPVPNTFTHTGKRSFLQTEQDFIHSVRGSNKMSVPVSQSTDYVVHLSEKTSLRLQCRQLLKLVGSALKINK